MKLLTLPDDGLAPVVAAVATARTSIELTIFRFDQPGIEKALGVAVARGVRVRALIAHTNRGGERLLRKLELRLLAAGVTLARSADDLLRYHGKMMIVDGRTLYLMLFNLTGLDARSRSFGIVTGQRTLVRDAQRLFDADVARQAYEEASGPLVVSPENARAHLARFLAGARHELWIYDPKISDRAMIRLLEERRRRGVDIRILGGMGRRARTLPADPLVPYRLHARVIIRDGREAFLGSQSLRALELDRRREIGLIVKNAAIVKRLREIFDSDWTASRPVDGLEGTEGRQDAAVPA